MRADLEYDVSDVHVHFGEDSILGTRVSARKLLNYVRSHDLKRVLAFSSDMRYQHYNRVLEDLIGLHKEIYGLVKVGLDYDKNEVFRLLRNPRFIGIKFHPSLDKSPVTNEIYVPLFKYLEKTGKVALIHCGRWQEVASYKFAFKIADNYPGLNVIIAHMGGIELPYCRDTIKLAQNAKNVLLETSNCYLPIVIEDAVKKLGDSRIMFGSDYPWGTCLGNVGTIVESNISEKSKKRILGGNFQNLLRRLNEK